MKLGSLLSWNESRRQDSTLPEYPVDAITANEFRSDLLNKGVVLLRCAVPDEVMLPIAEVIEKMIDYFDGIPADVIRREMESEDSYRRSVWAQILNNGVHYNYDLVVFSQGQHSLYDPVRRSRLIHLMHDAWPKQRIVENPITNVRRMFPKQSTGYSDTPLQSHVDAMFHQHDKLGVNFWLPLTTAGVDRPGISIVPLGVEETKAYLDYSAEGYPEREGDFANMKHFRYEKLEAKKLELAGLNLVVPQMNPGDALAFTNFTIHATYINDRMHEPRTSIEGRILVESI